MDKYSSKISEAVKLISKARCSVVLTGAGMSVASGIPDFRSPGGLWSKYDSEKVASIRALHSDPLTVWKFLQEAAKMMNKAQPNDAHRALAELERNRYVQGIITQNIDGLHQRAGSLNVIEFHGNCSSFYCMECFVPFDASKIPDCELPVRCPECSGIIRPDLVFYGEQIPSDAYKNAFELADQSDVVIVAGTSGGVVPASLIPPRIQDAGGKIIEINRTPSAYSGMSDIFIEGSVESVLPKIAQSLCSKTV
ncbi:SIR2 family NAD-dependent protein deacylase [Maridesulfovibrio zosterae]|uniref:SIR2 family NAD-dependent protein deacylase n=1 Tax=Maridesulfovibrio zosterae TaxID=82171 RepID=UPI0004268945|nr:NAD-dependent deacylase [Maridesulfovibrio zosterae]